MPSETKPNPENCLDCSFVCALHCAQLLHTILHRTDLIISPLTIQTITIGPMTSIRGKGGWAESIMCYMGGPDLPWEGEILVDRGSHCALSRVQSS